MKKILLPTILILTASTCFCGEPPELFKELNELEEKMSNYAEFFKEKQLPQLRENPAHDAPQWLIQKTKTFNSMADKFFDLVVNGDETFSEKSIKAEKIYDELMWFYYQNLDYTKLPGMYHEEENAHALFDKVYKVHKYMDYVGRGEEKLTVNLAETQKAAEIFKTIKLPVTDFSSLTGVQISAIVRADYMAEQSHALIVRPKPVKGITISNLK
ncbi:hypothetical protein Dip510_000411 [Elusimicrobium posterum]|uniref:hypothetical protein n=1 Tax=Elusimicrobium posterum TaxID=3116653 RepID=UPI003C74CFC8